MRKNVDRALAAFLLGAILIVFAGTAILYTRNYAYGFFKNYKTQISDDASLYENLNARLDTLKDNAKNRIFLRSWMMDKNTLFQMLLGKNVISVSGKHATKLKCGAGYNLFLGDYDRSEITALADFATEMTETRGISTMFVYCHGGLYEEGQLPDGLAQFDNNNTEADKILSTFRDSGVYVIDSRDAYRESGISLEDAILKSDIHWSHRMALETTRLAVQNMNDTLGTSLDVSLLDYDRFTDELHPDLFKGEFTTSLGAENLEADDIHVLYPAYDTHILYEEFNNEVRREGTFNEAVINRNNLNRNEETGYSDSAYYIYGHYLAETHTVNEAGAPVKVLIFKDSYGTPVTAFMGLVAQEVYAVDLRSTQLSMQEWVKKVDPDIVLFAYSQQMLRKFDYAIQE